MGRLMTLCAVAVLGCGAIIGAAQAQTDLPFSDHDAEAMMVRYADCVVGKTSRRVAVERFLRTVPNTEASYRASLKAADMTCRDGPASLARSVIRMRMKPDMLRDALYPALFRHDFGTMALQDYSTATARPIAADYDGDVASLPADYGARRIRGECVARSAPVGAAAFLGATPWSGGDTAAVEQLKRVLGQCLAPGQTARFNRAALRAIIGESMYKLTKSAVRS